MNIKKHISEEITNNKSITRRVTFESRVHENGESELFVQFYDKGEFDKTVSCLVVDKIEMKKLRQILNHCIGRN